MVLRLTGTILKDVLAPPTCSGCGERGTWLCASCRTTWPPVRELRDLCPRCFVPDIDGRCDCIALHPVIERAVAGFPYGGWIQSALVGAKYRGERDRAAFLGQCLASDAAVAEVIACADLIVTVPMYRPAYLERGYNQAEVMAVSLGAAFGCRVLVAALVKPVERVSQVTLTGRQRRRNAEGAFHLADHHGIERGCRIVVFDDTRTTGATVSACADALARCGADSIEVVTVAIEYTRDQQEALGLVERT